MTTQKGRPRLAADPSIGVGDFLEVLETFAQSQTCTNLWKLLQPPAGVHWKSVPHPGWLAQHCDLWTKYLGVASNGLIPAKKNRLALQKLCEKHNVNPNKKNPEEWSEKIDEWCRVGLSHLRTLRQQELTKQRCFRKADQDEIQKIQTCLDMLPESDGPGYAAEEDPPSAGALVPVEEASPPSSSGSTAAASAVPTLITDPSAVFRKVLNKEALQSWDEKNRQPHQSPKTQKPMFSPEKFNPFLNALLQNGALDADEAQRLLAVEEQKPINKGFKSQLSKANQAIKKKQQEDEEYQGEDTVKQEPKKGKKGTPGPKAKAKGKKGHIVKPKPKKKPLKVVKTDKKKKKGKKKKTHLAEDHDAADEDDGQDHDEGPEEEQPSHEEEEGEDPPEPEKPAAKKQKTESSAKESGDQPEIPAKAKNKGQTAADFFGGEDKVPEDCEATLDRTENRKLITSRAYHLAASAAWQEEQDWEKCKELGRQAHAKAGSAFDETWPRKKPSKDVDWGSFFWSKMTSYEWHTHLLIRDLLTDQTRKPEISLWSGVLGEKKSCDFTELGRCRLDTKHSLYI